MDKARLYQVSFPIRAKRLLYQRLWATQLAQALRTIKLTRRRVCTACAHGVMCTGDGEQRLVYGPCKLQGIADGKRGQQGETSTLPDAQNVPLKHDGLVASLSRKSFRHGEQPR